MERGRTWLADGNISLARLFFERAADLGIADAALAMGETFDAIELARRGVIGIKPDSAAARHWYEKARALGAGAAAQRRLERLGAR